MSSTCEPQCECDPTLPSKLDPTPIYKISHDIAIANTPSPPTTVLATKHRIRICTRHVCRIILVSVLKSLGLVVDRIIYGYYYYY